MKTIVLICLLMSIFIFNDNRMYYLKLFEFIFFNYLILNQKLTVFTVLQNQIKYHGLEEKILS